MFKKCLMAAAAILSLGMMVQGAEEENLLKGADFEVFKGKYIPGFLRINAKHHKFFEQDTKVFHGGKASLRISNVFPDYVSFSQLKLNVADFKHPIKITGWVKYENLVAQQDGKRCYMPFIGLWGSTASGRNSCNVGIPDIKPGSRDWFKFEKVFTPEEFAAAAAKVSAKDKPAYLMFRINIYNQPGTIWVDDLQLTEVE
ncbi:MAG: hypothetical protein IKA65_11240 [Lentisphaeria bacterium]|nr:hypothetical protein [Lentisphaeria bacterium]